MYRQTLGVLAHLREIKDIDPINCDYFCKDTAYLNT